MKFPSIAEVSKVLRGINADLDRPELPGDWIDVRLQVLPSGAWGVRCGSSDYDQDHRGYWGVSSVPGGRCRFNSRRTARYLIDQAKDQHAEDARLDALAASYPKPPPPPGES